MFTSNTEDICLQDFLAIRSELQENINRMASCLLKVVNFVLDLNEHISYTLVTRRESVKWVMSIYSTHDVNPVRAGVHVDILDT